MEDVQKWERFMIRPKLPPSSFVKTTVSSEKSFFPEFDIKNLVMSWNSYPQ